MLKVGIISKCDSSSIPLTEEIIKFLKKKAKVVGDKKTASVFNIRASSLLNADFVVCIGGDGTILRAIHSLDGKVPLLGINMGEVGFLADVRPEDAIDAVRKALDGFKTDERMRLDVKINNKTLGSATNEAVILASRPAKMLHFRILIDGEEFATLRGDGIVFATPTGSTAYAMSAGGPIVEPRIKSMIIVPLAPFTLTARPLVVPSSSKILVELVGKESIIVIDGQLTRKLMKGDRIKITGSKKPALFVRTERSFLSKVRNKLFEHG
jgi:NAD+ kinase